MIHTICASFFSSYVTVESLSASLLFLVHVIKFTVATTVYAHFLALILRAKAESGKKEVKMNE